MKEVDWSKAPEGATHYNAECGYPWLKETPLSYFVNGDWVEYCPSSFENAMNDLINAVKRPEWEGVGLPPVGTVCEYRVNPDEWLSGEVFGHRVCSNGDVQLFISFKNSWDYSSAHERFRPIKTPEQIAAEEKLRAIDEMMAVGNWHSRAFKEVASALYDAGYRKTEVKK